MRKVALTGGIATGKTYVLQRLRERGVATIDADELVHEALGPGTPTTTAIATRFGSVVLAADGSIDRTRLGRKVFGDSEARQRLEAIIHPVVYEKIRTWFDTLDRTVGVASIPLLYETHREKDFDFVVVTVCRPEEQLRRIVQRDGITEEQARQRIAAQMPAEDKARRADFVILTDGTTLATDRQVDELLTALQQVL
jgi:dephospho-CoA kinase